MPASDNNRPLLLVEGLSDLHFVNHLCDRINLNLDYCVEYEDGVGSVLIRLGREVGVRGRPPIGVIIDADRNIVGRWSEIVDRLGPSGAGAPNEPDPQGTIIDQAGGLPRIGIWIMPDNTSPGELEDFVIDMIPIDDPIWPMSTSYIDNIPAHQRKFADRKTDRAKLYAWLATRKQPPHIGAAIGAGDLDPATARCQSFVTWLQRLYVD